MSEWWRRYRAEVREMCEALPFFLAVLAVIAVGGVVFWVVEWVVGGAFGVAAGLIAYVVMLFLGIMAVLVSIDGKE